VIRDVLINSCYAMILAASNKAVVVSGHRVVEVREKLARG